MRSVFKASLVFLITIIAFWIFSLAFGPALDNMQVTFGNLQPGLDLPSAWDSVATSKLSDFSLVWRAIALILAATGAWVILTIVDTMDYTRDYRG